MHNFLFEGEAETTGHGSIQKIWVEDYGRYFLIFSKDGYETISTEVEFRNRIMNSSPDVVMKRDLNTALSIMPNFKDANLYYGIYLSSKGRFDESKVLLDKVITMEPLNKIAKDHLAIVNDSLNARISQEGSFNQFK